MKDRRVLKALLFSATMPVDDLSDRYQTLLAARAELALHRNDDRTDGAVFDLLSILAEHFPEMPEPEDRASAQNLLAAAMIDPDKLGNWSESEVAVYEDLVVNVAIVRALVRNYGIDMNGSPALLNWVARYRNFLANV